MKDIHSFTKHPAFGLLLAGASGAIIFGLYPTTAGLVAAYSPHTVMVANVYNAGRMMAPTDGSMEYIDDTPGHSMEDTGEVPEQI